MHLPIGELMIPARAHTRRDITREHTPGPTSLHRHVILEKISTDHVHAGGVRPHVQLDGKAVGDAGVPEVVTGAAEGGGGGGVVVNHEREAVAAVNGAGLVVRQTKGWVHVAGARAGVVAHVELKLGVEALGDGEALGAEKAAGGGGRGGG